MKHIKLFENFDSESIDEICGKYGIRNYTINDDGSVDVEGDLSLSDKGLYKLPLKIKRVNGDFYCSYNRFSTLLGFPEYVSGNFYCSDNNKLISLEGCPSYVGGLFACVRNNLNDLKYSPGYVGGDFYCSESGLNNLIGLNCDIGGMFYCDKKLQIIYFLLNHEESRNYFTDFYNFHIITNLDSEKPDFNLRRFEKFLKLYDLPTPRLQLIDKLKDYYNII